MIARHEKAATSPDIWAKLAAPLPATAIEWRQDGKITSRDGKFSARFVCFVNAQTVRARLDEVVPGDWDLTLDMLPPTADDQGVAQMAFKARLQVLGVIREDVGMGGDYKSASSDAFKRAAVRFGIATDLYAAMPNWVQMDGDGRFARPLEDPNLAYIRRYGGLPGAERGVFEDGHSPAPIPMGVPAAAPSAPAAPVGNPQAARNLAQFTGEDEYGSASATAPASAGDSPSCPKCSGAMWDNRLTKRNPKAPDFKCKDRSCDGVVWPDKPARAASNGRGKPQLVADAPLPALEDEDDELPFD